MGQKYRRIEDQKPWPSLALNQNFAQRRGLKASLKVKTSELGNALSEVVSLKRNGCLGAEPQAAGGKAPSHSAIFSKCVEKIFNVIG